MLSIPFRAFSYSNFTFNCPTKWTHTTEYVYCLLNVITQHATTHWTQKRHNHRTGGIIRIIQRTPTVGTENEHTLLQHYEVIYEAAVLYQQVSTHFKQGNLKFKKKTFNTLRTGLLNCLNARSRGLTFRHRASCICIGTGVSLLSRERFLYI